MKKIKTILLDVDGTLTDSNDAHAKAWVESLAEAGLNVPYDVIRRKIGEGADHLLLEVTKIEAESNEGKKISKRRGEIFTQKYLNELKPFPQVRGFLEELIARKFELIVASSASSEDLEGLLKQAGIADLLPLTTTSDDAEKSKPSPDIINAALKKSKNNLDEAVMIGDTPYDIAAATKAKVPTIAFTSGGWKKSELSGAIAVYEGPADLLKNIKDSILAKI